MSHSVRKLRAISIGLLALFASLALLAWSWTSRAERPLDVGAPQFAVADTPSPLAVAATDAELAGPATVRGVASVESALIAPQAGIVVRVVLAATDEPIEGATVRFVDFAALERAGLAATADWNERARDAFAERHGRAFRTDARGVAVVPRPSGHAQVSASHAGAWQRASVAPDREEEVRLALEPDLALAVRFVGAPAGELRGLHAVLYTLLEPGEPQFRMRATADADGVARFEHLALVARWARESGTKLLVAAEILAAPEASVLVDPHAWPDRPVELALPPTGRVALEFTKSSGALDARELDAIRCSGGAVRLRLARDELGRAREAGSGPAVLEVERAVEGTTIEFARVGLGLELELVARPAGWKEHVLTLAGPTQAGERVVARVALDRAAASLSGRLVDAQGRPFSERAFDAHFADSRLHQRFSERRTTDASGRFAGLGSDERIHADAWSVHFALAGEPDHAGWVALPAPTPIGPTDLGEIALGPPPLLARGRVVDERGAPVFGAEVAVDAHDAARSGVRRKEWTPLARATAITSEDGAFEIRSWTAATTLRLAVERSEYLRFEPLEFAPPRADLEIVLTRGGAIEGHLAIADLDPRAWIGALLYRGEEYVAGHVPWTIGGSFRYAGLRAGEYRIVLHVTGSPRDAHELAPVAVRHGETARLAPIDLDPATRGILYDVRDPEGRGVRGARFTLKSSATGELHEPRVQTEGDGRFRLRSFLAEHVDVRIGAAGLRSVSILNARGPEVRVVLQHGPRVRLALASGLPRIAEPWSLRAEVASDTGSESARFDVRGQALVALSTPGTWRVGLRLENPGELGTRGWNGPEWTIEVRDEPGEQWFESPPILPEHLEHLARLQR